MDLKDVNIKKRVYILVAIIVVIIGGAIGGIVWMNHQAQMSDCYAEIYQDNKLLQVIDLSQVKEPYQITVSYGDEYNVIEIQQGRIGIVEASCPDLLCQKMGFIDSEVMPITCLPNHLVIRIVTTKKNEKGYDSLVY